MIPSIVLWAVIVIPSINTGEDMYVLNVYNRRETCENVVKEWNQSHADDQDHQSLCWKYEAAK